MVKWWYNTGIRFHNLIGLFIVPITEELGFSRSAFTGTMTISMFSSIAMNLALGAVLAHTKRISKEDSKKLSRLGELF